MLVNQNNSVLAIISFFHHFLSLKFTLQPCLQCLYILASCYLKSTKILLLLLLLLLLYKKPSVNETHSFNSLAFGLRVDYEGFHGVNR